MSESRLVASKNRLTGEILQVPADKLTFRPSTYGIVIQEGKVLLNQCWDGYDFPGGGIEKGETIREALLREVKEETGLEVTPGELLYYGQDVFTANFIPDAYFHALLYYFHCTEPRGEISSAGFMEHEKKYMKESVWVPLEKIETLKFYNPVDSVALIRMAASKI